MPSYVWLQHTQHTAWICRDAFIRVTWLISMRGMSYSCVWHDSCVCSTDVAATPSYVSIWHPCHTHVHIAWSCWCVWHDSLMCVTWLVDVCDMTRWCVWHNSLMCVTWLVDVRDITCWCVWYDTLMCVTWLVDVCAMIRAHVWHDSLMCVLWHFGSCLIHIPLTYVWNDPFTCVTWLSYVCNDSCICVTWPVHMCDTAHSHVWHDSFTSVTWLIRHDSCDMTHACVWVWLTWHDSCMYATWLIHICEMTQSYAWQDAFITCSQLLNNVLKHSHLWHDSLTSEI